MRFKDTLVLESIDLDLKARTKDALFEEMAGLLKRNPGLASVEQETVLRSLLEREKTATTGVGKEVGIPHGKIMGLSTIYAAIGVSKRGIDYGSVDGLPVRYAVAMVAPPEQSQDYLRILAKVARLLSDPAFVETLVTAKSPHEVYDRIAALEGEAPAPITEEQVLLMFELKDPDYFDQVVEYFTEEGSTGATVLDARNVRGFLTRVPLFADFAKVFTEGQEFGHLFLVVIDKGHVERFVAGIEEIIGDLDEEGRGLALTLDVSWARGLARREEM
jgi:PTS system nitrogen regulatory IIA component